MPSIFTFSVPVASHVVIIFSVVVLAKQLVRRCAVKLIATLRTICVEIVPGAVIYRSY